MALCSPRIERAAIRVIKIAGVEVQRSWRPSRPFHPSAGEEYAKALGAGTSAFINFQNGRCAAARTDLSRAIKDLRRAQRLAVV